MINYINNLIEKTESYIPAWNQENFKGRWNYIDGVFLNAIVNLYKNTGDEKYKNFFINYINYYITSEGVFVNPKTGEPTGFRGGELDSICESRILFDAYEMTNDNRYLVAIETTYKELLNVPKTINCINYSHKVTYPNQIWLDGMYMYVPFYTRYAIKNRMDEVFDEITKAYKYIRDNVFDEKKKLYYHCHDVSKSIFWADKETGNSSSFWIRACGWFIVSLVDVIEYFPNGDNQDYLKGLLKEALEGIIQYQNTDYKMFYQVVDKGPVSISVKKEYLKKINNREYLLNETYEDRVVSNYLESSGSSMIAYSLMKAARLGYIDSDYAQMGAEVYESIYKYNYKDLTLNNICISAGLGPEDKEYRDGSLEYYLAEKVGSNDAKGIGPFIMAYIEYSMLNK
ncbi:MAG: glycoside hydrolase family 88 protein [Acholeplasmatales bacterium]|nr:glycoside hydrolase family 88 protein [Acholeplasmatales bacterium]